jgi:hydrogenase small subunit
MSLNILKPDILSKFLSVGISSGGSLDLAENKAIKEINEEITKKDPPVHIVWVQSQTCSGDTISLLNAIDPSLEDVLIGQAIGLPKVLLSFHSTVMLEWGVDHVGARKGRLAKEWNAAAILDRVKAGEFDPFILAIEGSVENEETAKRSGGFYCTLGEYDGRILYSEDCVKELSERATVVIAIGTCAAYGGIPAGRPNPTGARGVYDVLGHNWKSKLNIPVINVPGCPAGGDWQVKTFVHLLLTVKGLLSPPELDEFHRPIFLYGQTAHVTCPNGIYYAANRCIEKFGEPYCVFSMGCRGPIAYCPINKYPFVEGVGMCTAYGSPCIGCTMPEFPDEPYEGFLTQLPAPLVPPLENVIGTTAISPTGTSVQNKTACKSDENKEEM